MGSKERFYVDIMALQPEVTGSCNLVIVNYPNGEKTRFIVDCGLFQESEYSKYNECFPFNAENIEFCAITHNHVDHTGRLPLLVKKGFTGEIYTSKATAILLPLALADSYKVLKDVAKRNNAKQLYSESDVAETLRHVSATDFTKSVDINPNIRLTMFKNGHLIGAALILIQVRYKGYPNINLLFTGDYNNKNIFFNIPKLRKAVKSLPLTIIQESTYGTTNSDEVTECFEENVLKCIRSGGTVVNMAFSLGRFQEILYKLKTMQDEGKLSTDIPIFADGTLGSRLKMAQDGDVVTIGGMVAIKKARVEYTTEFSAHAKADEMIEFLQQFEDIKLILINHGETSVKEEFAKRILQEVNSKNVGILNREYLYRVGPYGFIKTMSTKFE